MEKTRIRKVNLILVLMNLKIPRVCLTLKGKINELYFFVFDFSFIALLINDLWTLL